MHTVRNRLASRPPTSSSFPAGKPPPHARTNPAYVQRGSMAVPLAVPEESGLIACRAQKRRNPKGKKARKAAARMAAAREAQQFEIAACEVAEPPRRARSAAKKSKAGIRSGTVKQAAVRPEQLLAIPAPSAVLGTYKPPAPKLGTQRAQWAAASLPVRPEPLIERDPTRVFSVSVLPELAPTPETMITAPADAPLPRGRALVPVRRQGLVDVIAFLLRDSGRRLARWSARRKKTLAERDALRRAEARQLNMQRELEALDTLLRSRG